MFEHPVEKSTGDIEVVKVKKIKIGVICPSEIAFRRFMPALQNCGSFDYAGIAVANIEEWQTGEEKASSQMIENEKKKALEFQKLYGGKIYESYEAIISDEEVDAIYLPLPPALHFKWAEKALLNGKNVFLEKPSTTALCDTKRLIEIAKEKGLAVHENYMFMFHTQLDEINKIIESGQIGDIRLYRIAFGFPDRGKNDFRYNKSLGGGALLDCGGYTLKLASYLLGTSAKIVQSQLNTKPGYDVDIYGNAVMENDSGVIAQIAFGMDNSYKCDLEVWGSKGCLYTGRVFTAPVGYTPIIKIECGAEEKVIELPSDDTFAKSLDFFADCINSELIRNRSYEQMIAQAERVEEVKRSEQNG